MCLEVPPCMHPSITTITSTDAAASANIAATDTAANHYQADVGSPTWLQPSPGTLFS